MTASLISTNNNNEYHALRAAGAIDMFERHRENIAGGHRNISNNARAWQ
jgi:hypothetical protein